MQLGIRALSSSLSKSDYEGALSSRLTPLGKLPKAGRCPRALSPIVLSLSNTFPFRHIKKPSPAALGVGESQSSFLSSTVSGKVCSSLERRLCRWAGGREEDRCPPPVCGCLRQQSRTRGGREEEAGWGERGTCGPTHVPGADEDGDHVRLSLF